MSCPFTPATDYPQNQGQDAAFFFSFWPGTLVTFSALVLILFAVVWIISGTFWMAAAYLAVLPLSLLVFFRSKVFIIKVYNRSRRFWL
jgi:hypothetical protein